MKTNLKEKEYEVESHANIFLSRVMTLDELSRITNVPKDYLLYEFRTILSRISPDKYQSVNRIICYLSSNYEGYYWSIYIKLK